MNMAWIRIGIVVLLLLTGGASATRAATQEKEPEAKKTGRFLKGAPPTARSFEALQAESTGISEPRVATSPATKSARADRCASSSSRSSAV